MLIDRCPSIECRCQTKPKDATLLILSLFPARGFAGGQEADIIYDEGDYQNYPFGKGFARGQDYGRMKITKPKGNRQICFPWGCKRNRQICFPWGCK